MASNTTSLQRLLEQAQLLATLNNPEDILAASCRAVMTATGAKRAYASCCLPRQSWDRGIHIERTDTDVKTASAPARSALFAIHRRLAQHPVQLDLERGESTEPMFRGLRCEPQERVHAVPIIHRTGKLWGEIVLVAEKPLHLEMEGIGALTQHTTAALENAQRLAFARRDQDRLLLLAEATDDALYDWDLDSRDFWWGGGILRIVGSDADPVENTARWKLERVHPDDVERVRADLEAARFSKAMRWDAEYRFRRQDGSYIDVEDRAYFLRDVGGRAYRMIGSMRDVTAMKQLLAREKEARAQAESASRAKDEFLAMLGHELRNPLAPIVTGLELVRMRGSINMERDLPVLQRQAQHLIRLVDDLLDISRIAHGKIELKKERFEISAVIASAVETASPLVQGRNHQLEVTVPLKGLEVVGDRARLAQAISNLLNNAAKYTEPGGRIFLEVTRAGDSIAISVRDTGIGIDQDMLPHVFNMFVQERQALDRSQGGLGLGLSIVRSLIELHGGTVTAKSAGRGHGSEFCVRIPAAESVVGHDHRETARKAVVASKGRRIMVVDDNEDAAELLSALLEQLGNTTRVAHDAHGAMQIVEDFEPDLAVLDIGLPVVDGYELARRLRLRKSAVRLIALTGYGQQSDKERATQAGFDAHLVKPVAVDALQSLITQLVRE